jgi:hypothetical protein
VPVLIYLSVVFLVVETPRYRTGIDPFIVMFAAVALVSAWDLVRRRRESRTGTGTALEERAAAAR